MPDSSLAFADPTHTGAPRYRFSRAVALLCTLLLHILGVWMLLTRDPIVMKPPSAGTEGTITFIAPPSITAQAVHPSLKQTPPRKAPSKSVPEVVPKVIRAPQVTPLPPVIKQAARRPSLPRVKSEKNSITEPETPPQASTDKTPPPPSDVAPTDDFSARIEAARKRREAAKAQDPSTADSASTETESERANRIARDNIAFQQNGNGANRDKSGGVFQIRHVGLHNAAFMFRGWNTNFKRDSVQLIDVDQGSEEDIENAVVKRMIALIRSQKPGEFVWDSHRLGRAITLNAGAAYEGELRQFLMKEFFPTYVRMGRR